MDVDFKEHFESAVIFDSCLVDVGAGFTNRHGYSSYRARSTRVGRVYFLGIRALSKLTQQLSQKMVCRLASAHCDLISSGLSVFSKLWQPL